MLANRLAHSKFKLLFNVSNFKLNKDLSIHICKSLRSPAPKDNLIRRVPIRSKSSLYQELVNPAYKRFYNLAKWGLIGSVVAGLGSVIYYGLGFRLKNGTIERNSVWPSYVKDRINTTYSYFGTSLFVTLSSAIAVANSPTLLQIKMKMNPLVVLFVSFSSIISCGSLVRALPYEEDHLENKHLAWVVYAGLLGAFVAPMILIAGPLMIKAAWWSAGVVSGLSLIVEKPPENDNFFIKAKPLFMGLLTIFIASVGGMIVPKTTKLGLNLYRFSIYGGFLLFGCFVFYDTHRIIIKAEQSTDQYDPLNESLSIYLNTLNILMRIAILIGTKS